jgi:hypothetical protein
MATEAAAPIRSTIKSIARNGSTLRLLESPKAKSATHGK